MWLMYIILLSTLQQKELDTTGLEKQMQKAKSNTRPCTSKCEIKKKKFNSVWGFRSSHTFGLT